MSEPYDLAPPEPDPSRGASQPVIFADRHRYCRGCGYDLHRSATARCAECGRPFKPDDLTTFDLDPPQPRWRRLPRGPWQRVALLVGVFAVYAVPVWTGFGWFPLSACCVLALAWPMWIGCLSYLGLSLLPEGWIDSTLTQLLAGGSIGVVAQVALISRWPAFVDEVTLGLVAVAAIFGALAGLMHRRATM